MLLVILRLIQDFCSGLTGGGMQIPGLFMLGLVYRLLSELLSLLMKALKMRYGLYGQLLH